MKESVKLAYDDDKAYEKAVTKAKRLGLKVLIRCDFLAKVKGKREK